MTPATLPRTRPRPRRDVHRRQSSVKPPVNPQHHGGTVVFEVGLTSGMTGADLELLRRELAMTTHVDHKLPVDPNSPAHAQLAQDSGLLLERGPAQDRWVLQGRTWGSPSARTVHDWEVRVAQAARRLDPTVVVPERMPAAPYAVPLRPVGQVANRRLAAARRRLTGLPSTSLPAHPSA